MDLGQFIFGATCFSLGGILGAAWLYISIVYFDWDNFKERIEDLRRQNRLKPPVQIFSWRNGKPKFLGWHGEGDSSAKRIYPEPHPGGRPSDESDRVIFDIMVAQNLSPEQAWQELLVRYPETLTNPETGERCSHEVELMLRQNFKDRMKKRKSRQRN